MRETGYPPAMIEHSGFEDFELEAGCPDEFPFEISEGHVRGSRPAEASINSTPTTRPPAV
jgi:hypothetical protein